MMCKPIKTNKTKKFRFFAFLAVASVLAFSFAACGGDDGDDNVNGNDNSNVDPEQKYSQAEQKAYLDEVGREFVGHVQTSEIDGITKLIRYVKNTYTEDAGFRTNAIEKQFEDCLDAIYSEKQGSHSESTWWGSVYEYTTYKKVYRASNFTGHFVAGSKGWEYTKANDLQFEFKDGSGNKCVLKLETSGDKGTAYIFTDEDWYDDEYNYATDIYTGYINENRIYLQVPERVVLTLTQGGKELIKADVKTDLSGLQNEAFDLMRTSLNVTADVTLQNFRINVEQVKYSANSSASVSVKFYHEKTVLLSATASCGLKMSGNGQYVDSDDDLDIELDEAKNAQVDIDVLGKVQVRGNISDVKKFSDKMEKAEKNDNEGGTYKSYINQVNELMNIGLYYNGGKTQQAKFAFEPREVTDWYERYWECDPVLVFDDGTKYSTFEAFFDETDFKQLIKAVENLMKDYEDEIDKIDR